MKTDDTLKNEDKDDEEKDNLTMFDVFHGKIKERIQLMILTARLPKHLINRTEVGAHYEMFNLQLSKQYTWDHMTGLLLIYPSCVLHVVESSREILISLLEDLDNMHRQPQSSLLEAPKVMFMAHNPERRLFQQWSYKVLNVQDDGIDDDTEEETTESLICKVLTQLQRLAEHFETSNKALPGSVMGENPDLIVSQGVLIQLLDREELLSPQKHLQSYNNPLNVTLDFGHVMRSSRLNTV